MPMGENGTPKSGQPVKWSWVTRRGALGPSLPCWEAKTGNYNLHVGEVQPETSNKKARIDSTFCSRQNLIKIYAERLPGGSLSYPAIGLSGGTRVRSLEDSPSEE